MEKKEKRKGNKKITKFCIHFLLLIFLILLFSQTIFASVDCPRNCDCYNDAHCQRWGQHCIITWWVDCDEDSDCLIIPFTPLSINFCETNPKCYNEEGLSKANYECEDGRLKLITCEKGINEKKCYCEGDLMDIGDYCCAEGISNIPCENIHSSLTYWWYNYAEGPADGKIGTGGPFELEFNEDLELFDEEYSLNNFPNLYNLLTDTTNPVFFSNYSLFFKFNIEYTNITYPNSNVETLFPNPIEANTGNFTILFCDPDENENSCEDYCYIGYNLSNEEMDIKDRIWDEETEECAGDDYIGFGSEPGDEDYRPDFLYQHVDDPDFSETFCTQGHLGVSYDNPELRNWNDEAFCCGDDNGNWYPNRNISGGPNPPTTEQANLGFNNYYDCAKTVKLDNKEILCNYQKGLPTEGQSEWYDSQQLIGEITYLPCIESLMSSGYHLEALSTGEKWLYCEDSIIQFPPMGQQQQVPPFYGEIFQKELTVSNQQPFPEYHSYFCDSNSPTYLSNKSIYECAGNSNPFSGYKDPEAGYIFYTGENISYQDGSQDKIYYCAQDTEKGPPIKYNQDSTFWTTDLDKTNQITCEKAVGTYHWTGAYPYHVYTEENINFCCGEHEDIQELKNPGEPFSLYESYNDINGSASCFNGTPQLNNNYVENYNELYTINGEIQGCAIDKEHALGPHLDPGDGNYKDNEHLLTLLDWPNPAQIEAPEKSLINDRRYCELIDESQYFCSYEEIWKITNGSNLIHLSFIPPEIWENETYSETQFAECCQPTECWNTTGCTPSQYYDQTPPYFGEYRCMEGEWSLSPLKFDWDNSASGYCPYQNQCLVNPSGIQDDPDNPLCINSDEYIGDHYCENGYWTTRTKYIALELLNLAKDQDLYTLYCDEHTHTLNNLNYLEPITGINTMDFVLYQRYMNGYTFNSINNFCILKHGPDNNVIIATSLNHPVKLEDPSNFINTFEQLGEIFITQQQQTGYQQLEGSEYMYYNNKTNSIIYSKQPLEFQSYETTIGEFFQNLFQYITNFFTPGGFIATYDFINNTKDFDKVYVSNQKQVVAIREKVTSSKEHLSVSYWGTGADICETIEIYDNYISEIDSIQCNETSGIAYISSALPEGINVWSQMTSKLRPQKAS